MSALKKQAPVNKSAESSRYVSLSGRSTSLLIVIISILVYEAVSSQSTGQTEAAKVAQANELRASETISLVATGAEQSSKQQQETKHPADTSNKGKISCEYEKGQWNFCEADGSQTKVSRLKTGDRDCKANKTIRRDCETVGCKYARGQWSSACINGQRFRVDTLVERIGAPGASVDCKASRRVTRDCRRTCHYVKSAWSECVNGTRTRLLTLVSDQGELNQTGPASDGSQWPLFTTVANNSEGDLTRLPSLPTGGRKTSGAREKAPAAGAFSRHQAAQQCASRKLIRRACRQHPGARVSPPTPFTGTSAANGARRSSLQPSSATPAGPTPPATNNMTPAQKRRLKLMQVKQQQQQSQTSGAKSTAATAAGEPTTTNHPTAAAAAKKSPVRDRRR